MRLLILTASLWALVSAKPEMYKESEDFQYSRSSSDEGTKSGFYGAQRGNMGGNFEKAHNMDSMAQHHMSTLVRQVDGELGEGANTNTGSVFTAGKSRGIYGSGSYDLSNLKGRNFGENGAYDDTHSQSALYQNARYQGNSYAANNARYGSEQSLSSKQRSGYSASNLASQYSNSDSTSENKYHGASNYDYGARDGSNTRYYSIANSQARGAYDESNTNLHSTYDLSNQNRLTSATPVKVYIRPGGRVAVPISAPTYTLYSSNLQDKNVDTSNVLGNSESELTYKPTNNAKHYESSYRYHKKWEKHDTQPLVVVPTENPFPANSELYEDRQVDQNGQRYQSELDSLSTNLNEDNKGYSANQNYQSGITSASIQSSKTNSAYSSGYSANTKTASASQQARYQSEAQKAASASSNTFSHDTHNLGTSSNLNNLVEDINSRPKSYHSSYSYHKAWERRGDPYVIIPSGDVSGQTSQRLTAASQNQGEYSSQQYGSHYNQKSYSNIDCDAICHLRRKRSYNINQYEQDLYNTDLEQQSQNGWDLGQQTENKFENLEDLGQATQNTWDNFDNLGQQTQNKWDNLQNVGQETQNKWNNIEDNSGQQTQNNWDHLADLGQQVQSEWNNQHDLGQKTENQGSQLENLGQETQQQTQGEWSQLEDLGQTQSQWGALGHEAQSKWDAAGQAALNKMDNLGQETQSDWSKLEDLGEQKQTNQGKPQDIPQAHNVEEKIQPKAEDSVINDHKKIIPIVDNNEPANKFLWDTINQMFEEPPKTDNNDRVFKNGESLVNNNKELFDVEKKSTNKQPKDQLSQPNDNEEKISTTLNNNQQSPSTVSIPHSEPKDVPDKPTPENTPTNPFEIEQTQGTNLDQQSENQWAHLGQQSEHSWSNLGQQSENSWSDLGQQNENSWSTGEQKHENGWSNLGQQSETHWGNLGQESQNPWSNLGQLSENHWSNLGQQSEHQWGDLGQQSEHQWGNLGQQNEQQWGNLGQQSEHQWGNLGQQSEHQWGNLGQQSEHQWGNLGQQSEHQWGNLGQQSERQWGNLGKQNENHWSYSSHQTHHVWSNLDKQNQFTGGQQHNFNQDKSYGEDKDKTETEITQNAEDMNLKEFLENFQQVHNWNHYSQTNKQNQPTTKDTEEFNENHKDLITGDSVSDGNQKVEHLPHDFDITSSKLPNNINEKEGTSNSETTTTTTTTEVQKQPSLNRDTANIGRGDIGSDDDSYELGTHNVDEKEKPNLIVNNPSTTMKPTNSEYRKPYSPILIKPTNYNVPEDKPKFVALSSQEQNTDQQQFEQQNLDLQQTQEDLSVLPASPKPIQLGRSLESVPLEKIIQQHDLTVSKPNEFAEQATKRIVENIESSSKKDTDIEAPLEPTTEKPGFWNSVWNKTKKAKNSVVSWFKN